MLGVIEFKYLNGKSPPMVWLAAGLPDLDILSRDITGYKQDQI